MKKETYKFGVFDIESEDWLTFKILGFFDGQSYKTFEGVGKFLSHIDNKIFRGFNFYAHNAGKFDDLFLLEEIVKRCKRNNWNVKMIERGGRIICLKVETTKTRFNILDSYALLPDSLKNLGVAFDVQHKKQEMTFKEGKLVLTKKLLQYLENDCLCLYEVLQKFFASEFVVNPKMTIASQALDTFQHLFCEFDLCELPIDLENYFRTNFYSGGRVEVYKGYGKKVHCFDVNSLYPSVMVQEMPQGEMIPTTTFKKGNIGFYKVKIHSTPQWYISPLLIKRDSGFNNSQENLYVNGAGEYYFSSATLEYLVKTFGIKFTVLEGFYFKKKAYIFNEYVETFFDIKQKNKGNALGVISKLMLNSLYGKFGMKRERESVEFLTSSTKNYSEFDNELGLVLVSSSSRSKFILPYLAGYITDLARLEHFKLMQRNPASQFYCDTDSIFTSSMTDYKHLVSKKLGAISYEGTYEGIFLSPKSYALRDQEGNEEITFKGFSSDSFSYSDFEKVLKNEQQFQLTMVQDKILSFKECLSVDSMKQQGKTTKRKVIKDKGKFLKMVSQKKVAKSNYDKRTKVPSVKHGFDSQPLNWFPQLEI